MLIKKYKTLKSVSTILSLNNIVTNSSFFCFVQIKHLDNNEWLVLKQLLFPFSLNIFICKNAFLKSRNVLFNLPKYSWDNLSRGNLVILYSNNYSISLSSRQFFTSNLFLKKIKMFPLIFYYLKRFFLPEDFFKLLKFSKYENFYRLIYILQCHNYGILNKLVFANKLFLCNLNYK